MGDTGTAYSSALSVLVAASSMSFFRAEQPGAYGAPLRVEAVAFAERGQERLSGDVVGDVTAEASRHIPVDLREVPVIDHFELIGLMPRPLDHHGVVP
ncbi:hypothetical protein GCM10023195_69800 [Actinoallomurus liliacearum]|uniref:Uncharacterized protein n=1 Tax=Actinoallomurus liliacearum TaxID=1080073 RepID=A0ABP8TWB0_9ACTN